jgi:type II secretory ATPase GspE/PulE/Tfp pilus assembly ATPase PilB-like protein
MFKNGMCWRGAGCDKCDNSGYRGRLGFFEVILTNSTLRQAISERVSASELNKISAPLYNSMRRDGVQKAAAGFTTVEEVLRATQDADEAVG